MATIKNARDVILLATSPRLVNYTTAPGDVGAVLFTIEQFGARITWPVVSDPAANYELKIGGSDWATATSQFKGIANSYLLGITASGGIIVRVKAFNPTSGLYSTNESTVVVSVPVAIAPTVSYAIVGVDETLSWTFASTFNFTVDHFEIRYGGSSWATATFTASTKSTYLTKKVDYVGNKKYWVAGIDAAGNPSNATSIDVTIVGPGTVTSGRVEVVDNNALLYWALPATGTMPIDKYVVSKGATYAGSTPIGNNSDSTFTAIFEQQAGVYTYWIVAFDSAGNSSTPVGITATINQPPDYILRSNFNSTFATTGYSTVTLNSMYVESGKLYGPVDTTQTWATHYSSHGWSTPADQISAGFPIYADPSVTSGTYEEVYPLVTLLNSSVITATINYDNITGTVTPACQLYYKKLVGDSWIAATAGATSVLATDFQFVRVIWTFTCTAGANLIRVNSLNITLANKLRTDSGTFNITTAVSGVVVPFNLSPGFIDADTPICQPNGTTPLTPVVDFTDVPNPTSFTVYLYNAAGTKVTGSGSWTARGY